MRADIHHPPRVHMMYSPGDVFVGKDAVILVKNRLGHIGHATAIGQHDVVAVGASAKERDGKQAEQNFGHGGKRNALL